MAEKFSQKVILFYIPINSVWMFQFLYNLTNTWNNQSLILAILMDCIMTSHYGFSLLLISDAEHLFMCVFAILVFHLMT